MDFTDSSLFDRKDVRMTLSKAQKYLSKLKAHQGSASSASSAYDYGYAVSSRRSKRPGAGLATITSVLDLTAATRAKPTFEDFKDYRKKLQDDALAKYTERCVVSVDISNLKDELFAQNSKCGVSKILTEIDFLNAQLTRLKQFLTSATSATCKTDAELEYLYNKNSKSLSETYNSSTTWSVFAEDELKAQIKLLSKKVTDLEFERDKRNALNHITVKLSSFSREVIGLDDGDTE